MIMPTLSRAAHSSSSVCLQNIVFINANVNMIAVFNKTYCPSGSKLNLTVAENMTGSCGIIPSRLRRICKGIFEVSIYHSGRKEDRVTLTEEKDKVH